MRGGGPVSAPAPTRRGRLYVIAAPSGTGKTSLVRALMERTPTLAFSVSHTTRPRRPTELDGRDYHFTDKDTFRRMIAEGAFLEHASVFDNLYGTGRAGAQQVRERLPEAIDIFILPPSRGALEERLRGRATDSDEVIARRLRDSVTELSHWAEFRYVIVNDRFEIALSELERIVAGDAAAYARDRPGLAAFAADLLA